MNPRSSPIVALVLLGGCTDPPRPLPVPRAPRTAQSDVTSRVEAREAPSSPASAGEGALPVAPRAQDEASPAEGFCGETAIQEGLLLLGVYASQRHVNRLGNPAHPDLYSNELPVALRALGVRFTAFSGKGYRAFVAFANDALTEGKPVVAGVKILPTAHPEWGLDHFVLVVGVGANGLLVDTTWGTREETNDTRARGISLVNAGYGLRLDTIDLPSGAERAHLAITHEDGTDVGLRASCPRPAILEERRGTNAGPPTATRAVTHGGVAVRVPREGATYFRCVPRAP